MAENKEGKERKESAASILLKIPDSIEINAESAADAFFESEQFYVQQGLRVLHELENRLKVHNALKMNVLDAQEISRVFLNVSNIYDFHKQLMGDQMKLRLKGSQEFLNGIGLLMKRFIPFFKLYSDYVEKIKDSSESLQALMKKNKTFKDWVTLNEACTERSIATLLEFPVVRLPQYLEYLGAIHAHMPSDAKGCDDLELAIKEIQKVPDQIAKSLRSQKNRKQVVRVQEEHFRGAVALVDPTRSWIREGEVTVTYNKSKGDSNKQLNAFLFNDMLLFGTLGSTFSSPSVKYIVQVCGMLVENIPDGHDVKFAWRVRSQLDDRAFTVSAPTYQAKVAWMRALAGQIAREDTTKQTKVLHPEEFEKRIIKKKNDESRLLPRPKAVIPVVPDLPPSLQKQDSAAGGGGMSSPRAGGAGMGPGGSSSPSSAIDGPEALLYGAPQKPQKPMTLRRPVPPAPGAPGAPGGAAAAAGGATAAPPAVPRPPPRPPGHPHPPPAAPGGPAAGTAAATSSSSTSSGAHDEAPPPVPAFDLPSEEPPQVPAFPSDAEEPARIGEWERLVTETGEVYFENVVNPATQWDPPQCYIDWRNQRAAAAAAAATSSSASSSSSSSSSSSTSTSDSSSSSAPPPPPPDLDDILGSGPSSSSSSAPPPPPDLFADLDAPATSSASASAAGEAARPSVSAANAGGGGSMLDAIKAGVALKKPGPPPLNVGRASQTAGPADLFAQIKAGATLRKTADAPKREERTPSAAAPNSLQGALAKSLQNYRKFVQMEDNDESDEEWV